MGTVKMCIEVKSWISWIFGFNSLLLLGKFEFEFESALYIGM